MPEVFAKLVELLMARGHHCVQGQLVTIEIDQQWRARFNGIGVEIEGISPAHVAFDFNGMPAGVVGPFGGAIVAGELANEDTLLAAINAQLAEIEKESEHA